MGAQLPMRMDRWTDIQDKPIVNFCNFVNASKNCAMLMKHSDILVVTKKIPFTAHKNMQLAYNNEVYVMTSEILMAVIMYVTAFCDVMPVCIEEVYGISKENVASIINHDGGGNSFLLNIEIFLPHYMTSHIRIQQSSRACYNL